MRTRMSSCAAILSIASFAGPATAQTARTLTGRWQGVVQIPAAPAVLVVDLDQTTQGCVGSLTAPGHGWKGLPLTEVACENGALQASVALFGGAKLRVRLAGDTLAGTLEAGGNTAALELKRAGAAQVDLPSRNPALAAGFEGLWNAQFELGWKRSAELSLRNEAGGTSSGEMKLDGAPLKLERIVQDGDSLRFKLEGGLEFEGRLDPAVTAIEGHMYVAGLEGAVRWQRATATTDANQEPKK